MYECNGRGMKIVNAPHTERVLLWGPGEGGEGDGKADGTKAQTDCFVGMMNGK